MNFALSSKKLNALAMSSIYSAGLSISRPGARRIGHSTWSPPALFAAYASSGRSTIGLRTIKKS